MNSTVDEDECVWPNCHNGRRKKRDDAIALGVLIEVAKDAVEEQARHNKESLHRLLSGLFPKATDDELDAAVSEALLTPNAVADSRPE